MAAFFPKFSAVEETESVFSSLPSCWLFAERTELTIAKLYVRDLAVSLHNKFCVEFMFVFLMARCRPEPRGKGEKSFPLYRLYL